MSYLLHAKREIQALATFGACVLMLYFLLRSALFGSVPWLGSVGPAPAVAVGLLLTAVSAFGTERVGVFLVTAGAFLTPMYSLQPGGADGLMTYGDVLLAVGFFLLIPQVLGGRRSLPPMFLAGAALLFGAGTVASTFSVDPALSFADMARVFVASALLPTAFVMWGPSRERIVAVAGAYCLGSATSVAYGLLEGTRSVEGRLGGLATHANGLGLTALFSLALIPFLFEASRPHLRWVWVGVAAINAVGVWESGSRAAFLVALAMAVFVPVMSRSARVAGYVLFGSTVGLMFSDRLLRAEGGGNPLVRLLGRGSAESSNTDRAQRIENTLAVIRESPLLGSGFIHTAYTHVIYLEIMAAAGLFGLVGFSVMLLAANRSLFVVSRPFNALAYPAVAYTLVALITSVLWDRFIWVPVALSLVAWGHGQRPPPDQHRLDAGTPSRLSSMRPRQGLE